MMSLRWKIVIAFLLVTLIPLNIINRHSLHFFDHFSRHELEQHMIHTAWSAGAFYQYATAHASWEPEKLETITAWLRARSHETGIRIQLVGSTGSVLADSEEPGDVGADYSHRPEIVVALDGRYRARSTLTPDRSYMYYYCALPIRSNDTTIAIAYTTRHTSFIIRALQRLRNRQRQAAILAMIIACGVAVLLAQTLTARLRRLTAAAGRYARGHPPPKLPEKGRDEIAALARTFNQMVHDIESRNQEYRAFTGDLVHELKTPLSAIRGAVEILRSNDELAPEIHAKFLDNIAVENERMNRLVSELRDLSLLEAAPNVERPVIEQNREIEHILDRLRPMWEEAVPELIFEPSDAACPTAWEPGRLEQVLANLLDNAVHFTPVTGHIIVRVRREEDQVITEVRDTGPGIPEANLSRVFDRFFTTARHRKEGGSGLGLAVVATILRRHQGSVEVCNNPHGGTLFTFRVPVAE